MRGPYRVGLTGGIGSGKSTVTELFAQHGAPIIDADEVARQVVEPGSPALQEVVNVFGTGVLDAQGRLDRSQLRREIFEDRARKRQLERILHPRITQRMEKIYERLDSAYCIFSVPLLIETRQHLQMDRVLVLDVSIDVQVRRVTQRDHSSPEEVMAIIETQISREARLRTAHDVIDNSGSKEGLRKQVARLHARYLELAERRRVASRM